MRCNNFEMESWFAVNNLMLAFTRPRYQSLPYVIQYDITHETKKATFPAQVEPAYGQAGTYFNPSNDREPSWIQEKLFNLLEISRFTPCIFMVGELVKRTPRSRRKPPGTWSKNKRKKAKWRKLKNKSKKENA